MEDLWAAIGLLLFGVLLFCLCCYKVSNLLYMFYNINVDPNSIALSPGRGTGDLTEAEVNSVVNAAVAAAIVNTTATSVNPSKSSIKTVINNK